MRREDLYLSDIVEAADAIARFISGISWDRFRNDELVQSAVLQKLMIIGESASRLSEKFKSVKSDMPWKDIIGFRNIAIHAYFSVDWQIVWKAATMNAPELRRQIARILETDYPGTYEKFVAGKS